MNPKPYFRNPLMFILTLLCAWITIPCLGAVLPVDLRCEYRVDPLGIDNVKPRLSWKISDSKKIRGQKQTGYQVLVASSLEKLNQDTGDLWDSRGVVSAQSVNNVYEGAALKSGQECFWKVRVKDADGTVSDWSPTARFSIGLLNSKDWKGEWIQKADQTKLEHNWFRKNFTLTEAPDSAFVYVASLGYHELYVNGEKVTDGVMNPVSSYLKTRVPYFPHESAPKKLKAMYPPESIKLRPNVPEANRERARKEAQGYYAHRTALDQCVGDLHKTVEEAGIAEHTIFIFTSDHGEMLGSQGQKSKQKQRPWDESIRVPFLFSYPKITGQEKRVVKTPINTPDILPTLLSLSGVAIPDRIEGEDLSRLIIDKIDNEDRAALVMSVHPFAGYNKGHAYRGIRTIRYTYVRNETEPWLLYDNKKDPYQMKNLVGSPDHAAVQEKLEKQLQAKLTATNDTFLPREEYLKAWGYSFEGGNAIPWRGEQRVQSPVNRPKV